MIKKQLLLAAIAVSGLALVGCSDEVKTLPDGPATLTLSAKMPAGISSRAFSTGAGATVLSYAVYDAGTNTVIYSSAQADAPVPVYNAEDMTFSLDLDLVKGQSYDLIFWADTKDNAFYTFNPDYQTVTISYEGLTGNDDTRDAFFNVEKDLVVTGSMTKSIQLYRPFAQINIGTDDTDVAKRAGIELGTTAVSVKNVYAELNLYTGIASQPATVTFPAHAVNADEVFPVTEEDGTSKYTYLSMNYILTGSVLEGETPANATDVTRAQQENKDIEIAFVSSTGREVNAFLLSAVPVKRNFRTNIYGSLLTSNVNYTIVVVPDFYEEPGIEHPVTDLMIADGRIAQ